SDSRPTAMTNCPNWENSHLALFWTLTISMDGSYDDCTWRAQRNHAPEALLGRAIDLHLATSSQTRVGQD
ncbi:hypothetical protein, partial [Achromobacter xylosoxidans]|uniref:hypothetical protein n=1 Tax=Alcaligenes xylosoxydans xylosoxydans TaxID=85698 RepID=UPI001F280F32